MDEIKVLINEKLLQSRIKELAKRIEEDYKGKEIVVISVLKGAVFFTVDLAKQISNDMKFEFIKVSSYGSGTTSCGEITLSQDIKENLKGKDVLIVEDIIDTGNCMKYLLCHIREKNPATLKVASLLNKPERRQTDVKIDYIGFDIPNKFVVGYGLDVNEKYRNLSYIGYIEE